MKSSSAIILFFYCLSLQAELCPKWGTPYKIGNLPQKKIVESSGLAISSSYKDRVYHINDSGDRPNIYITSLTDASYKVLELLDIKFKDTEDLALGPCFTGKRCLFVGDIGDNRVRRDEIVVALIIEEALVAEKIKATHRVTLKYPDGAHNAEGMAIHPITGDLYILTKEQGGIFTAPKPARLYRVEAKFLQNDEKIKTLEFLWSFDIPTIVKESGDKFSKIVTGISFNNSGDSLIALTYEHAYELNFSKGDPVRKEFPLIEGVTYQKILLERLPQQEAIAMIPNKESFLYTSEYRKGGLEIIPIMRVDCKK